ncbi:ADP-ribosylation factor-like protein 2-binding protein isoform X2 [Agrilus planipennis]|uniref:ADP-ribosylation factor-like protein 2-binding protein n=1 Tax=Agrilus planipennis TaxID=224129 RepID=A0A1W4XKF7_AGRPL|nr:ADP-ribosylation factor-like protein 2-binding protein isoform X2 [Agrilus planipennis]
MCKNQSVINCDIVIGYIEEIIMDTTFVEILTSFMEKYWKHFDSDEENKLIYSDIFYSYQETIEKYIEKKLMEKIDNFSMKNFEEELIERRTELDGEIFEILATFSDFLEFKEMFLDYKRMKEGSSIDFSEDLLVKKCAPDTVQ